VYCAADQDARAYFLENGSEVCFSDTECSAEHGLLSYNKRDYKKKHAPRQALSAWIIAIGQHSGIVSGRDWVQIQKILAANKPSLAAVKAHNEYAVLSGMIYCDHCGAKLFAKMRNNNPALYDYICANKLRGGRKLCDCQNLNGHRTDDLICEYVLHFAGACRPVAQSVEKIKADFKQTGKNNESVKIDEKIRKIQQELDNLVRSLTHAPPVESFLERIHLKAAALSEELDRLSAEKTRLRLAAEERKTITPETLAKELSDIKTCFNAMTVYEKRQLVQLMIRKIEWRGGQELRVYINGDGCEFHCKRVEKWNSYPSP
jgi:site-specific DNA recombinase